VAARRPRARIGGFAIAGERNREIVRRATGILTGVQSPGRRRTILGNYAYIVPDTTAQSGRKANPVRSGSKVRFDNGLIMGLCKIAIWQLPRRYLTRECKIRAVVGTEALQVVFPAGILTW
jgi:hypothetical protein